jgi:hypothetical protein
MAQIVIARQPELARIDAFLAGVAAGAQVLVIESGPGMGKTTLWLAGLEGAANRDWRVLSSRPSEAEATFAHAGIGDLLAEADEGDLAPLSAPQRRALRVALMREEPEGEAPNPGLVAASILNTLRGLARTGPVLVAVDDVQWLDSPSALALGFAIRRLGSEPIGILLARRIEGPTDLPLGLDRPPVGASLERLAIGPLDLRAIGEILHARLGVRYPRVTLGRIHATSGGNPLFALELGRALGNEPATLEAGVDLPLPDELMALLTAQLSRLPAATQDALAIVAALAHPTVELVAQVADGPAERTLQPAVDAHVIAVVDSGSASPIRSAGGTLAHVAGSAARDPCPTSLGRRRSRERALPSGARRDRAGRDHRGRARGGGPACCRSRSPGLGERACRAGTPAHSRRSTGGHPPA